jgi:hypothetical protein
LPFAAILRMVAAKLGGGRLAVCLQAPFGRRLLNDLGALYGLAGLMENLYRGVEGALSLRPLGLAGGLAASIPPAPW